MEPDRTATVTSTMKAPIDRVWKALVDPQQIERYMFGARVASDWKEGSSISWKGEWQGRPYEDTGEVLHVEEPNELAYSHASGGDKSQTHIVKIHLEEKGPDRTEVTLTQDNNASPEALKESEKNWTIMLDGMKKMLETSTN